MERNKLHCRSTQCSPRTAPTEGKAGGLDATSFFFFFSSLGRPNRIFILCKVKSYCIFQHGGNILTSYTSLILLRTSMHAAPTDLGGTCIFSVLFKDQLEQGILKSDDFARASMLREKNLEQQADDELYFCGGSCSLSTSERRKETFRLIKPIIGFFPTCMYNTLPLLFFASFPPFQTKVPLLNLIQQNSVINYFLTNSKQSSSFLTSQGGFCTHDCLHLHQQPVHKKIEHLVVCRTVRVTVDLRGRPECQTCSLF